MATIKESVIWESLKAKFDVDIEYTNGKKKVSNMPKWTNIKTDVSTNRDNVGIITGKINDITVIDLDIPKDDEIDGISFFEENICKVNDCKFVVKTPRGGYHLYYKYCSKLKTTAKIQKAKLVSIDVRNDKGVIFGGKGYTIIKDCKFDELEEVPESFILINKKEENRKKDESVMVNEKYSNESIQLILKHLNPKFLNSGKYWFKLLVVLKNIGYPKELIKEYSSDSELCQDNFDEFFDDRFDKIEIRETPNVGTLMFFLKESVKEDKYKNIIKNIKILEKSDDEFEEVQLDDESCYKIFSELYQNKIITDLDNSIYLCNEFGIWIDIKKNDKRLQKLIFDFNKYLKDNNYNYNLKTKTKRNDLKEELLTYLQITDLQFDKNPYLLPFKNGVIDLTTGIFRNASPDEYINKCITYCYEDSGTELIEEFFNSIFSDSEIKDYFIICLSLSLENINRKQVIVFMIGPTACNGKSTILELIDDALDTLGRRIPTNILTGKREISSGTNEALMVLKNARFAYCSEPEHGEKININVVKEITGDKISCRGIYGKQETFKINANIFLASQYAPDLDTIDAGIIRRVRIIPFVNKFVNDPKEPNEKLLKTFSIEDKEKLKIQLVNLLVKTYVKLYQNNFEYTIPKQVLNITQNYFEDNNDLDNFINDNFEFKVDSVIKISEVKDLMSKNRLKITDTILKTRFKTLLNVDFYKEKRVVGCKYYSFFHNLSYKQDDVIDELD